MLQIVSNAQLIEQETKQAEDELEARQNSEVILGLTGYIRSCWDAALMAKQPIEAIMLKALRQRNGKYEADKLAHISMYGGSTLYMMITEVKCRAAESWLRDILLDTGSPPWDMDPTPIPELSPQQTDEINQAYAAEIVGIIESVGQAPSPDDMEEIKAIVTQDYRLKLLQGAYDRAQRMKYLIADQFTQGGWADAFNDFITDLVTYPCAFLKGPVVRRQKTLGWVTGVDGKMAVEAKERLAPEYERVDPFRVYPEPGIKNINEGYIFQHHPMSRMELSDLIGVPGYDDGAIRKVLHDGFYNSWVNPTTDEAKNEEERKFQAFNRPTDMFDVLEFWGKVSGKMLLEWGLDPAEVPDDTQEYDANVWIVGNYVLKAVLNYDPLGEKPYVKTSFIKCPGAFWGKGIPEIIADLQDVCNASARALINNMALASGPQVEVNLERIPAGEDITSLQPWKIWQVTSDPNSSNTPALRFNQPDDNSHALMQVYEKFSKLADDHSGIPSYVYGDLDVKGAGRTSSGLSMLMGAAGKGIRQVVMYIDSDVIKPVVQRQFVYNMRYDEDETIKGDVEIVAKGSINLAVKETVNVRRLEFLNATNNETDMQIIGLEGRTAILREVAKGLQMPVDDVIPSREKESLTNKLAMRAQIQTPQDPTGGDPENLQEDGSEKGGQAGNVVVNKETGNA